MVADAFESTTDERTMRERSRLRSRRHQKRTDDGLLAKMRSFVDGFMAMRAEEGLIGAKREREEEDEAPVLKPRTGMRYRFSG